MSDDALTARELYTSAGPADVCIVDTDGTITVVECKLASSSEKRRMVIGQVLDYASAISLGGEGNFHGQWLRAGGPDLASLGDGGRERLENNIAGGRVHMCLAVDQIDSDLRRLVEHLNRITRGNIRVTAVQLTYARHGDLEILVPSTYGGELATAKGRATGTGSRWTKAAFLDAIGTPDARARATTLFDLQEAVDDRRGTKDDYYFGLRPSGGVFFHPYGHRYAPFYLWINITGTVMCSGLWTNYNAILHDSGFSELAQFSARTTLRVHRGVRCPRSTSASSGRSRSGARI
ncbi:hypothetical protein [Williamsia sp. D3]|uniref:hypothetical protein n=1 Tax=Williamsia sp. D3 TaxID=1313067 RepID=UPI0004CF2BF5|nr:hypothetical protein [Williamsia sp. D3]